jgi:hypothetical protein
LKAVSIACAVLDALGIRKIQSHGLRSAGSNACTEPCVDPLSWVHPLTQVLQQCRFRVEALGR